MQARVFALVGISGMLAAVVSGEQRNAPRCRVFASAFIVENSNTATGSHSKSASTCKFDRAKVAMSCVVSVISTDPATPNVFIPGSITTYRTIDDFVTETRVVPPLDRSLGTTMVPDILVPSKRTYDRSKRLVRETSKAAATFYTAWDSVGRPIASRTDVTGSSSTEQTYSYDDAARTMTIDSKTAGDTSRCTYLFDENGVGVSIVCSVPGGSFTRKRTVTATETVCP